MPHADTTAGLPPPPVPPRNGPPSPSPEHRRPPRHPPHPGRLRPPPGGNPRTPSRLPQLLRHRAVLRHRPRRGDPRPAHPRPAALHGAGRGAARPRRPGPRPGVLQAPRPRTRAAPARAQAAPRQPRTPPRPHPVRRPDPDAVPDPDLPTLAQLRSRHPPPPDRPGADRYLRATSASPPACVRARSGTRSPAPSCVSRQPAETDEGLPPPRGPVLRHGSGPQPRPRLAGANRDGIRRILGFFIGQPAAPRPCGRAAAAASGCRPAALRVHRRRSSQATRRKPAGPATVRRRAPACMRLDVHPAVSVRCRLAGDRSGPPTGWLPPGAALQAVFGPHRPHLRVGCEFAARRARLRCRNGRQFIRRKITGAVSSSPPAKRSITPAISS